METELIKFKGEIVRNLFSNNNYQIYAFQPNKECSKFVKKNSYGNIIIVGNIGELSKNVEYEVEATEQEAKKGLQYKVFKVRRNTPTTQEQTRLFLQEIITPRQTNIILEYYPNIIDLIMNGKESEVDLNKLKGIKEHTFTVIKRKIIQNFKLIELVDKFKGNIEFSVIRKLYDHYPSVEKIIKVFSENPYACLCSLSRIGFKTADKTLLKMEEEILNNEKKGKKIDFKFIENLATSKNRMEACIDYLLEENQNEGNTWINGDELYNQCEEATPECIDYFNDVLTNLNKYYIADEDKVFVKEIFEIESYLANKLTLSFLNSKKMKWYIDISKYNSDKNVTLTDEQLVTLQNVCDYNVSILTAPAGAGKSQSIKMLVSMLDDNNKTYSLMTPTGKSSDVLADYVGKETGTIHRQLGYNPSEGWRYNKDNPLPVDAVIIDEFGMVDIFLMKHLLEAIDFNRTKLLFVFDSYQLASVSCGNIAHDLLTSNVIPVAKLTKVFRYNEGGLMQIATKIRNSEKFLDNDFTGTQVFGENKDYVYVETNQEKAVPYVLNFYSKLINNGATIQDIMVLTSYNKGDYGTIKINEEIQNMLQKDNKEFFVFGENKYYIGDKVMQNENNYKVIDAKAFFAEQPEEDELDNFFMIDSCDEDNEPKTIPVYNGNMGIITDIRKEGIIVQYKNKTALYKRDELSQLRLGYSVSIHKSQGDSASNIILLSPKAHTYMLNSNLLYVGVTRAKKRVYHIGNIKTINQAIKKKENLQRNTYLRNLLIANLNKINNEEHNISA